MKKYFFIFIISSALFLRLHNIDNTFVFGVDEEYQTYLAQSLVKNFHILWIGVGSTAGFYLGPLFTYFTYLLLLLSKDPLIFGYVAALAGTLSCALLFSIAEKMFNKKTAFVSSSLFAFTPLAVYYDQKYWNVGLVPLLTLALLFTLYKAQRDQKYVIAFACCFALIFHIHLALVPIGIFGFLSLAIMRKLYNIKTILLSIAAFLLVYSPLLGFDYYHNFSNAKTPLRLLRSSTGKPTDISSHLVSLYQTLGRVWYLPPFQTNADEVNWGCTSIGNLSKNDTQERKQYWQLIDRLTTRSSPKIFFSLFSIGILGVFYSRTLTWRDGGRRLVALFFLIQCISFLVFPGGGFEYYLIGMFPLFFLICGLVFTELSNKWRKAGYIFLTGICLTGAFTVVTTTGEYGLRAKRELISQVNTTLRGVPFELKEYGMCHIAEGWRYLFSVYGDKPVKSSTDEIFGWIYPDEFLTVTEPQYLVIMAEARIPFDMQEKRYVVQESGGFKAYLLPISLSSGQ